MNTLIFLVFAPVIGGVLGLIGAIIGTIFFDSKLTSDSPKPDNKPVNKSVSSSHHHSTKLRPYYYDIPDNCYSTRSSLDAEITAHNARMEQLMRDQNRILIENDLHRTSESIRRPLSEKFDTRLTNIFRNPWEGIL